MEIDDLKKVWTKINNDTGNPVYSAAEITDFRKARSKDFSTWIQNGLILDIILKGIFIIAFFALIFLMQESQTFAVAASGIIALCILLIVFEIRYFRSSKQVDRMNTSVQEGILAKLKFLKTYYYRIQFLQGLTNPIFVSAGVSYYYYQKYGQIKIDDSQDILVLALLLFISFLFTLPTTLSLYGYHYRVLQTTLASLEDGTKWENTINRYRKQKKILHWVLGILLAAGIIALAYLILI